MVDSEKLTDEEFMKKVTKAMEEYMGEGYRVAIQKVRKNNGVFLTGISVFGKGRNISPTVYLEEFYEQYRKGISFGEIMKDIIQCYETHICRKNLDMSFFSDYEWIRKRIAFKLVNREKNHELLKEVPYIPFLNLAVLFFCTIQNEWIGNGTVLVRNHHLKMWNVNQEKLFEDARRNTPISYPAKSYGMSDLLAEITEACPDLRENGAEEEKRKEELIPMCILTNEQKTYGASVLLYEELLRKTADQMESDLVILPSSIHEVIAVPVADAAEAVSMEGMVREINQTQVDVEDVLSDQVYYYERATGRLSIAADRCE